MNFFNLIFFIFLVILILLLLLFILFLKFYFKKYNILYKIKIKSYYKIIKIMHRS